MTQSQTFINESVFKRKPRASLANTSLVPKQKVTKASPVEVDIGKPEHPPKLSENAGNSKSTEQLRLEILESLKKLEKESEEIHAASGSCEDCFSGSHPLTRLSVIAYPEATVEIQADYPDEIPSNLSAILNEGLIPFIQEFAGKELIEVTHVELEDFTCGLDDQKNEQGIAQIPPEKLMLRIRVVALTSAMGKNSSLERMEGSKSFVFVLVYDPYGVIEEVHLPLELVDPSPTNLQTPQGVAMAIGMGKRWLTAVLGDELPNKTAVLPCLLSGLTRASPLHEVASSVANDQGDTPLMVPPRTRLKPGMSSLDAILLHSGLSAFQSPYCELPIHLLRHKDVDESGGPVFQIAYLDMGQVGSLAPQSELLLNTLRRADPDILDRRGLFKIYLGEDGERTAAYLSAKSLAASVLGAKRTGSNSQQMRVIPESDALDIGSAGLISYLCEVEDAIAQDLLRELD